MSGALDCRAAPRSRHDRAMLSTPETRFSWAKRERNAERSFFHAMLKRWRKARRVAEAKERDPMKAKPAWTPWLWMK
jgi:hypothetical protein